jgi:hypothetical protein
MLEASIRGPTHFVVFSIRDEAIHFRALASQLFVWETGCTLGKPHANFRSLELPRSAVETLFEPAHV